MISVSSSKNKVSDIEIAKEIVKLEEVQEVHLISGECDILVKVRLKNVEDVEKFVLEKIRKIKGVEKTQTCIVFNTQKETTTIKI